MKTVFFLLYCALLFAALLAAVPFATLNAAGRSATPVFERFDRNKDGFIDPREAESASGLAEGLGKMDANRDGKLDRVEFARW